MNVDWYKIYLILYGKMGYLETRSLQKIRNLLKYTTKKMGRNKLWINRVYNLGDQINFKVTMLRSGV